MRVAASPGLGRPLYTDLLYTAIVDRGVDVETATVRRLVRERFDIVHIHWPEWQLRATPYVRMVARSTTWLAALTIARRRGARLIWTVHNVDPHETTPPRFSQLYWRVLTRLIDGLLSPSPTSLERISDRHPRLRDVPSEVTPIGHLRGHYPDHGSRASARAELGLDTGDVVITCFGQIRPYKGVEDLIETFRDVERDDLRLIVAGRPFDDALRERIEALARDDARIELHLEHVPDDRVQHLMRAADLAILPYAQSSNSFVALLALSFDRPLIAPSLGAFPELAERFGSRWVRLYDSPLTSEKLVESVDLAAPDGRPELGHHDWSSIADTTVGFYERVAGSTDQSTAR